MTQLNAEDIQQAVQAKTILITHYNADLTPETHRAMKGFFYAAKRLSRKLDLDHKAVVVDCKDNHMYCKQKGIHYFPKTKLTIVGRTVDINDEKGRTHQHMTDTLLNSIIHKNIDIGERANLDEFKKKHVRFFFYVGRADEDFEIFEFYWDELLTKQVGSCIWSKEVRRYKTICEAVRKEHSHKRLPMITPEDEAFTVLVIENSYDRWLKEIAEEKDGSLQEMKKKRPANYYNGLYTLTDSGQNEWGGWKVEGLELFNKYVDMNRAARKERNTPAVEEACLQRLKKKHNIVCDDHKTQVHLNKKRKQKCDDNADEPNKPKALFTIRPEFHNLFFDGEGAATAESNASSDDSSDDDNDDNHGAASLSVPTRGKLTLPLCPPVPNR